MDFASPIESLVTGSRGKVLAALARSGAETTLRGLSRQADVSPNHVGTIIGDLVELGLVERREAPPASLVRLSPTNIQMPTCQCSTWRSPIGKSPGLPVARRAPRDSAAAAIRQSA